MRYYEYFNALSAERNTVDVKGLIKNAQKEIPHTSVDIREYRGYHNIVTLNQKERTSFCNETTMMSCRIRMGDADGIK